MPSHEEALSIADICLFPCPSSLPVLHTRAKQSGGWPGQESFWRPEGRGGHWVMAFSSLAWGLLLLFSSTGITEHLLCATLVLGAVSPHSCLWPLLEDAGVPLFPGRRSAAVTCLGKSLSSLIKHHFFFFFF